jgi:DNA polymerase III sliding clamp (beta) subunit (PCNA family)
MTATMTEPETTETEPAGFSFIVKAGDFVAALKSVAAFACTDTTLPAICGVRLRQADGSLTLTATDRYTLATQTLTFDYSDGGVTGDGELVLPASTVKALSSIKGRELNGFLVVNVAGDGTYQVTYPDDTKVSYPANPVQFPNTSRIIDGFKPAEAADLPSSLSFNPAFLARFAKVSKSRVTITPGTVASNMVRFECGEVTGLICMMRQPF